MSKISLTTEQYDLLKSGGMQGFFKFLSEDTYEIVPMHAQEGYDDEEICIACYEREEREKCLGIACNVPVKSLDELFSNAEKVREWLEGSA